MSLSHSPSPAPTGTSNTRHARNALEKQRQQLERLLKDPTKPASIPPPPKEKMIRPPRDMMKNVQGSSAGAGSGEFHVYKASRRREYERLKALSDGAQNESVARGFEERKRQREEEAETKTAKNRAKRQKKKDRAKGAKPMEGQVAGASKEQSPKKRRVVNGKELVFRKPGEESDGEGEEEDSGDVELRPLPEPAMAEQEPTTTPSRPITETPTIIVHDDD
ncbi:DUF1168-domain-containing protein [Russula earlei]|uniref:DUF1168-domain-containing protein n=1 Tax=Russula earlei TaxID=71964 RepID=A0ACC0U6V3_9AGAM|nr:DUF1168-domain-containing protein [Russula earlei]